MNKIFVLLAFSLLVFSSCQEDQEIMIVDTPVAVDRLLINYQEQTYSEGLTTTMAISNELQIKFVITDEEAIKSFEFYYLVNDDEALKGYVFRKIQHDSPELKFNHLNQVTNEFALANQELYETQSGDQVYYYLVVEDHRGNFTEFKIIVAFQ